MNDEIQKTCPHCGASLKAYWRPLNPILVRCLVKAYVYVNEHNQNKFHFRKDLGLKLWEYSSFQNLRYHGLIAHYKENGERLEGYWLITHRAAQFLRGEIQIPAKVRVFRNAVTGHSEQLVTVQDVIKEEPFKGEKYSFEFVDLPDNDNYDPGKKIGKRSHKKDIKYCPKCESQMVKVYETKPGNVENSVYVKKFYKCNQCHYREEIL